MIVTTTLNPALDRRIVLDKLEKGKTLRSLEVRETPGGKGLNVALAAKTLGANVRLLGFAGGHRGKILQQAVRQTGIRATWLWVAEETRISTFVQERQQEAVTELLEPGPNIPLDAAEAGIEAIAGLAKSCRVACISGGLPPGLAPDYYARCIRAWQGHGVFTILDASEPALRPALRANPDLVKVNRVEAEQVSGTKISSREDGFRAMARIQKLGARSVILSLGARGALVAHDGKRGALSLPRIIARNPVGAGDCMVAGVAWAIDRKDEWDDIFLAGAAAGTAKASCEETGRMRRDDFWQLRPNVSLRWL